MQRRSSGQNLAVFDAGAPVIAPGHQPISRRRANRTGRIGVRKPAPFARKTVEVRSLQLWWCPITPQTSPAIVITENHDDVWLCRFGHLAKQYCHTDDEKSRN